MPRSGKRLTRTEQMIQAAERGDIDGIFKIADPFADSGPDQQDAMDALRVALEKLAGDPERLVEELFSRILQSQAYLMIRCQRYIDRTIAESDQRYPGLGDIPKPLADEWLPRLSRLQHEVQATSKCLASLRHTFSLSQHGPIKTRADNVIHLDRERSREVAGE